MTPEQLRAMTIDERRLMIAQAEARAIAAFPYECIAVPGLKALGEWKSLRAAGRYTPVIVSSKAELESIAKQYSSQNSDIFPWQQGPDRSVGQILEAAASLRWPEELLQRRISLGEPAEYPPLGREMAPAVEKDGIPHVLWDSQNGDIRDEVILILIPTSKTYEVPAYLKWSAYNLSPSVEFHVAALKHWHEWLGAELIGIGRDYLEAFVRNPPLTLPQAIEIAKEEYLYCPENIGDSTLSRRAAELMARHWWFFWWD
jgi:hypothetical protein